MEETAQCCTVPRKVAFEMCARNTFNYPKGELDGKGANAVGGSTRVALGVDPEGALFLVFAVILERNKLSVSRQ